MMCNYVVGFHGVKRAEVYADNMTNNDEYT